MGWFERLSGSDQPAGARHASVVEKIEIKRYKAHHRPLKSEEALQWNGHLLTGYHLRKASKDAPTEYVRTDGPGSSATITD